jgi:hypothetical protein
MIMLVTSFFSWWYGRGWQSVALSFKPRLTGVLDSFSAKQLARTLFAPWRCIIIYPGASFDARARALVDNLFSRLVGFVVRVIVLLAALAALLVVAALSVLELVAWPLLPFAIPGCLIAGLVL